MTYTEFTTKYADAIKSIEATNPKFSSDLEEMISDVSDFAFDRGVQSERETY